ncbi:MAG TPA: ABC transporter permease [Clostridiales bacterium]|nr:ABC transporter permease [Clostridiales bacterium]
MKAKHVLTVFKKEVKDILRDKKTIISSILLPMVLIPFMNILVGGGVQKLQKDITENISIALAQNSKTEEIRELVNNEIIGNDPNIALIDIDDPIEAIKKDKVRVVLEFEEGYAEKLKDNKPFSIKILYDNTKAKSEGSLSIVRNLIDDFNNRLVKERLLKQGINPEILEPAKIELNNIADSKSGGNFALSMMLPFMVAILVAAGGIPAATDLIAGEKERNTFEPLLATKPDRASILAGKYLTVILFSFVSVIAIMIGFAIGYIINPNSVTMGTGEQLGGFNIPVPAILLSLLLTITMGVTFAGIQIALSTYARSFKEAQTYLSFLMFAAMIPGYMTIFMQASDIKTYMFLIPVLNTISAFKMVLGGAINYTNLILALVSSVIYTMITLALAVAMFKREKVLFRS